MLYWTLRKARQVVVAVVGATVLLTGIIMIVTPGPAIVVIPLGLGILATEFVWARMLLNEVKDRIVAMAPKKNRKPTEEQK
jgi:uncharacterized protein (TIGR02611 family)